MIVIIKIVNLVSASTVIILKYMPEASKIHLRDLSQVN